jgi:hypothetical protein
LGTRLKLTERAIITRREMAKGRAISRHFKNPTARYACFLTNKIALLICPVGKLSGLAGVIQRGYGAKGLFRAAWYK